MTQVLAALEESLSEVGLGGRIRVGGSALTGLPSVSAPPIPHPSAANTPEPGLPGINRGAPGGERAEEVVFPLDDLLRPIQHTGRGRLIELAGETSSGRTSLAYRLAAGATARGELVGWVDLPNALDPRFLRRSGVDLRGLLWSRPPHARAALRATELLLKSGFAVVVVDLDGSNPRDLERLGTGAWTRLVRAVHATRSTAVVLGPSRVSGSFSTLGIYTERCQSLFDRGLFEGLEGRASVVRNRTGPCDVHASFSVFHRPSQNAQ